MLGIFPTVPLHVHTVQYSAVVHDPCKDVAIVFEIEKGEEEWNGSIKLFVASLVCLLLYLIASNATVD